MGAVGKHTERAIDLSLHVGECGTHNMRSRAEYRPFVIDTFIFQIYIYLLVKLQNNVIHILNTIYIEKYKPSDIQGLVVPADHHYDSQF